MTEKEKMNKGMWYDANYDENLYEERRTIQNLCNKLSTMERDSKEANDTIEKILGYKPDHLDLIFPFMTDYGKNIHLGKYVFINYNCYFMDGASITIGDHAFIGPYCGFYTASHPLKYKYRNQGLEKALPIVVGDNCWFGANVSVMPGVTIGNGVVIAAGSVVTKDIPDNVVVGGVPATIIKKINQEGDIE